MIARLDEILRRVRELNWKQALYARGEWPWRADTPCLVLDPDEGGDEVAAEHGMDYVLSVPQIQDVVENAHQRGSGDSMPLLVQALNHYYEHDAFPT